jgi:hypothetical protein
MKVQSFYLLLGLLNQKLCRQRCAISQDYQGHSTGLEKIWGPMNVKKNVDERFLSAATTDVYGSDIMYVLNHHHPGGVV